MESPQPFHEAVLTPRVRTVFRSVAPLLSEAGFYLGGGTAVALWYGHRRSVDLDWFTEHQTDDVLVWERILRQQEKPLELLQIAPQTLITRISGIKVSLFSYPYPLLKPPVIWDAYQASIASPEDLLCMKLIAVQQRGTKRDFIDLYMLLQQFPFRESLALCRRKYGECAFLSLQYALTYFDEAEQEVTPRVRIPISWRQVKAYFRNLVKTEWQ